MAEIKADYFTSDDNSESKYLLSRLVIRLSVRKSMQIPYLRASILHIFCPMVSRLYNMPAYRNTRTCLTLNV